MTQTEFNLPPYYQEARYRQKLPSIYLGNPMIEALPPILLEAEAIQQLKYYPVFNPDERNTPGEWRVHSLQSVFEIFAPLPLHLSLEQRFSRVIRWGYKERNPLAFDHWQRLDASVRALRQGAMHPPRHGIRSTARGFTLLGISGIGKTTAIERILSLYPQIIQHHRYREQGLLLTQLTWLKLECPHDGSVKGLCINFFKAIDELLYTNYHQNYARRGRATVDEMLPAMARVASIHKLGALIIDELQHLSEAKSGGAARMLNFFVQLVNTIGMPVILIGTYKAKQLLSKEFRQARRSTGEGDPIWENMQEDEIWRVFLKTLWQYQFVRHPVSFDDELSHIFYDETQGITDLAAKLFVVAQMRAISSDKEKLTPAIIRSAAADLLRMVASALDAMRRNDRLALQQFEDISLPEIKPYIKRTLADLQKRKRQEKKKETASPSAPQSSSQPDSSKKKKPEKNDRHLVPSPDDLRSLNAGAVQDDAAQALQAAGAVASVYEYLDVEVEQKK